MLLLFIPVLIILFQIISFQNKQIIFLPVIAAVLVQMHGLGYTESALSRFSLLFIILFALFFIILTIRTDAIPELPGSHRRRRLIYTVAIIYLVLLGISLLSVIAGAVMLAEFITYAIIKSTALILITYALSLTINSILFTVLYSKGMASLNLIKQYQEEIYRKIAAFVRFLAWVFWLILTFRIFTIWDELYSFLENLFTNNIKVGTVDISMGNIILFIFLIWFTIWLSRMVKIVIEGEIAPRIKMKRGVPGALSLILRMVIITIGFLFAIAVAGIGMDKLAILLGALGVGIGFGLQSIFNNLVSGIILAFERPVQEGDIIEVGELWGTVKEIGLRSSTIFTFYGAEVIVPNGNLISNELINWTLTDQQRRVEVEIGVAYGTNPEKVLDILRNISLEHKGILDEPVPLALFSGFGDSSLDFRLLFWIPRGKDRFIIQSEVNVLINKSLKDSGIEIPFPQRDLHVKSVNPEVMPKTHGPGPRRRGPEAKGEK
jgi:small-conductance mechanosensitive channel